jgi:LDH2 family malate/lactate/ureidoglycolate dehydrogenase
VKRYPAQPLREWATAVAVALGAPEHVASVVAAHLVAADASGHASHGLRMFPVYAEQVAAGALVAKAEPVLVAARPAYLLVDGGLGFGHYAAEWTLRRLVELARVTGVAAAHIIHCGHVGRLGGYVEVAATHAVALLMTNGTVADDADSLVAPYGGRTPMLGTNPIAFGCPADPPLVVDLATSAMAYYELRRLAGDAAEVPDGVLIDAAGRPTRQASDALDGGTLLPFGGASGHKGYGLSLLAGILGGLAGGEGHPVNGTFLLAIDLPGAPAAVQTALTRVRRSPSADPGRPVLVPGDRGHAHAAHAAVAGIPVDPTILDQLAATGLAVPNLPETR